MTRLETRSRWGRDFPVLVLQSNLFAIVKLWQDFIFYFEIKAIFELNGDFIYFLFLHFGNVFEIYLSARRAFLRLFAIRHFGSSGFGFPFPLVAVAEL